MDASVLLAPVPSADVVLVARFRARVRVSSECWEWTGGRYWDGYGHLRHMGRSLKAHRVAWELFCGPIPAGLSVLHRCDNPPCVRPDHLWLGTQSDNIKDMVNKGRNVAPKGERHMSRTHPERIARGERHGTHTRPASRSYGLRNGAFTHPESRARGERNGASKLTEAAVREIRALLAQGTATKTSIATLFGVDRTSIARIARQETWSEVAS